MIIIRKNFSDDSSESKDKEKSNKIWDEVKDAAGKVSTGSTIGAVIGFGLGIKDSKAKIDKIGASIVDKQELKMLQEMGFFDKEGKPTERFKNAKGYLRSIYKKHGASKEEAKNKAIEWATLLTGTKGGKPNKELQSRINKEVRKEMFPIMKKRVGKASLIGAGAGLGAYGVKKGYNYLKNKDKDDNN